MSSKILHKIKTRIEKINIENTIDKIAIYTGLDISLMRRGLYPMPGPNHINLKQPGLKLFDADLTKDVLEKTYKDAWRVLSKVNTIDDFIKHDNITIKNYETLNNNARKDPNLREKMSGHESVLSYSKEKFYTEDFPITLYINKSLGKYHAMPFMTKLILLEQRLLGLRDYLPEEKKENTERLITYAINHEHINKVNYDIKRLEALRIPQLWKNNRRKYLNEKKAKLQEKESEYNETELYYGQLAAYFLSDDDTRETRNIKKWVDTHIEFEVYRTLFAYGIREATQGRKSKKSIDLALEYATYSRPNCGFIEKIYTNKVKIYSEILNKTKDGIVELSQGKKKRKKHALLIGGIPSKLMSYEEFEQNHLSDLKEMGLIVRNNGTHTFKMYDGMINYKDGKYNILKDSDFEKLPTDDMLVGSKTNTMSLYGSALFNGILGSFFGLLKSYSLLRGVAPYIKPKMASINDEFKMIKFSPGSRMREMYNLNKEILTGEFYEFTGKDLIAEKLAYESIKRKTHFSSYFTLQEASRNHSIESLIQTNNATDFFKNTLVSSGIITGIAYMNPEKITSIPEVIHMFPTMFGITWAAFSGVFDKPIDGVMHGVKYLYRHRDTLVSALEQYKASPFE